MSKSDIAETLRFINDFGGIDASLDKVLLAAFEDHGSYTWALDPTKPFIIWPEGCCKIGCLPKNPPESRKTTLGL